MTTRSDVAEREFFHGSPVTALPLLRAMAGAEPRAAWLLGAALGALGRYGEANVRLTAVPAPYESLAASTLASHYRQLGRHQDARQWDEHALKSAEGDAGAEFDARLGLAADAVGTGDLDAARANLVAASGVTGGSVPGGGPGVAGGSAQGGAPGATGGSVPGVASGATGGWRRRVRLGWVETEVALLAGDPALAVESARAGLAVAEGAAAPRHVAKCQLFLGVARHVLGAAEPPDRAVDELLATAGRAAGAVGAVPLRWVCAAVLADRADSRGESDLALIHRRIAATAIHEIGAGLPEPHRNRWLGRVDIAAIVSLST